MSQDLICSVDKFEDMLYTQLVLQKRLGYDFIHMTYEERTAFIKEMSIHLNQEVNEALYELPFFKPWKDYSKMTEEEKQDAFSKFIDELVDAWHFFMNLILAADITPEEFYKRYLAKNKENHKRQDKGYTHDISYRKET